MFHSKRSLFEHNYLRMLDKLHAFVIISWTMFHSKTSLFDHIYLSTLAKMTSFCNVFHQKSLFDHTYLYLSMVAKMRCFVIFYWTMFHTKISLFDHIYLRMMAKITCFCNKLLDNISHRNMSI